MKIETSLSTVLFGFKSSGKTYFGSRLAQELGLLFIDTDRLIESLYNIEFCEECDCRQIFLNIGEINFRRLEERAIASLKNTKNAVIAVGGGALLNQKNSTLLRSLGPLVYLKADKEKIKSRIFNSGSPPFLDGREPEVSFDFVYESRRKIYESIPAFKIEILEKSDKQVLDELTTITRDCALIRRQSSDK